MRVALLGNMNNNHFVILRFLLDHGLDAHLLLYENELAHFMPEMDTYSYSKYKDRVHQLTWGSYKKLFFFNKEQILKDLAGYDFFIGSRLAPAYFFKAGKALDLLIPAGGELHSLPFFNGWNPKALFKWTLFSQLQKRGLLKNTRHIMWGTTNPDIDNRIGTLGLNGKIYNQAPPILYLPEYVIPAEEKTNPLLERFGALRQQYDLMVGYHCRHTWKTILPGGMDNKDTQKLFIGFASFLKTTRIKACIVTFEYGPDVEATKTLCRELGITDSVYWFPLSARKNLMAALKKADILCGEFHRSFYNYGAVYESLALGKPFMHFRDDALYAGRSLYPMLNAQTSVDIVQHLQNFEKNPSQIKAIGDAAEKWFTDFTQQQVAKIVSIVNEKT